MSPLAQRITELRDQHLRSATVYQRQTREAYESARHWAALGTDPEVGERQCTTLLRRASDYQQEAANLWTDVRHHIEVAAGYQRQLDSLARS